jgi:hypoxanthine phosphoribosyltransferase
MRTELLTWEDVDRLMDVLLPQLKNPIDAMLLITRGGIVPGGIISEALDIKVVLTAAVDFPMDTGPAKLLAWPEFLQFPADNLLAGKRVLIVDDVWGSGRTITAVKNRVEAAGGYPELCVLHYNPTRTLFNKAWPTYYAAITDARIRYPWEIDRSGGLDGILATAPETN